MDGIPAASPSPINPPATANANGEDGGCIAVGIALVYLLIFGICAVVNIIGICTQNYEDRRHRFRNAGRAPDPSPDERRIKEVAAGCTECAICLEEYSADGDGVRHRTLRPCGHRFHKHCIDAWLSMEPRGCPICRGVLRGSSLSVHHVV